jgi:hypothetical protein
MILFLASIRTISLPTAITFYSIILGLPFTKYTGCTHVHKVIMQ